jgi:uncharacterized RDD family membrane protein YckC
MDSMLPPTRSPIATVLERFLPRLKYPHLFVILAGLLVLDLVLPDPIPLLDELGLAVLTLLVGAWRIRREPDLPPRDVTPPDDDPPQLPSDSSP